MLARMGHRVRWTAVWVLLLAWFAALIGDVGGGLGNVLLVLAVALLLYELLAAE